MRYSFHIAIRYKFFVNCDISIYCDTPKAYKEKDLQVNVILKCLIHEKQRKHNNDTWQLHNLTYISRECFLIIFSSKVYKSIIAQHRLMKTSNFVIQAFTKGIWIKIVSISKWVIAMRNNKIWFLPQHIYIYTKHIAYINTKSFNVAIFVTYLHVP